MRYEFVAEQKMPGKWYVSCYYGKRVGLGVSWFLPVAVLKSKFDADRRSARA